MQKKSSLVTSINTLPRKNTKPSNTTSSNLFQRVRRLKKTYYPSSGKQILDDLVHIADWLDDNIRIIHQSDMDWLSFQYAIREALYEVLVKEDKILQNDPNLCWTEKYAISPFFYVGNTHLGNFPRPRNPAEVNTRTWLPEQYEEEQLVDLIRFGYHLHGTRISERKRLCLEKEIKKILQDTTLDDVEMRGNYLYNKLASYKSRFFSIPECFGQKVHPNSSSYGGGVMLAYAFCGFQPAGTGNPAQRMVSFSLMKEKARVP